MNKLREKNQFQTYFILKKAAALQTCQIPASGHEVELLETQGRGIPQILPPEPNDSCQEQQESSSSSLGA